MNDFASPKFRFSPDHGGNTIKGGGPHSDPGGSGGGEIADALGETEVGRGRMPGINDPGVPGSRTNPVTGEPQLESDEPVGRPTGEGSGAGS